ncbi:MAG: aminopeptidase N [Rhodanobacteraceae bacterium]
MNARTEPRRSSDDIVRLADYRVPAWWVEAIELTFDLDIEATILHARLHLRRERDEPLRLEGDGLQLLEVRMDGRVLAEADYLLDDAGLTIPGVRDRGVLETRVRIEPASNTALSGLYLSGSRERGFLLTQCEAQGFRHITFFPDRPDVLAKYTVTLRANAARFPVLLAGGDPDGEGDLPDGRHWARFVDPHPKPGYLFALVAGHLEKIERAYRTAEGRDVTLRIWAEADAIGGCDFAMDSLERAMRWDERVYGRNYDLSVFNIVATHDFNMGAMENKGLNIFNAKYLLADPDTTTDDEYRHIEAVVAHEYFHNWSGNRVTCRDWFQLSLKEGFTVFREQSFCADMQSAALQRIDDVAGLRRAQFPEDAGPLAHPVRPSQYRAIDNFYTATVYEKGAELVRMLAGWLGPERFRRGTDLYFSRHDGQAVTIEDFLAALGDANDLDLSPYLAWYAQAGTPCVRARGEYDAASRTFTLHLAQHTPPTPGQPDKQPLPIPVRIALFARDGSRLRLRSIGESVASGNERVLELAHTQQAFVFEGIDTTPVPSLLRGFSAPVTLQCEYAPQDLALLLRHESEGYDRWNAAQQLALRAFDARLLDEIGTPALAAWLEVLSDLFDQDETQLDPALLAELSRPPSEIELGARVESFDPDAVHAAREKIEDALATRLRDRLLPRYGSLHALERGAPDSTAQARRRLKGRVLSLLLRALPWEGGAIALVQFQGAQTMTDRLSALGALTRAKFPEAAQVLRDYRERYDGNALALDKWFTLQAQVPAHAALDAVRALTTDPAYAQGNPNRVQALLGAFARGNPVGFHRPDGAAYRYLADQIARIDAMNPQLGARLAKAFEGWHKLEPKRRAAARSALEGLSKRPDLSRDLDDMLSRMLGDRRD